MKKEIIKFVCLAIFLSCTVTAQSLKQNVKEFFLDDNETHLKAYLEPLSMAFGATLGSSTYFNAKAYRFPHFDFGINYLTTPISKKAKVFESDSILSSTVFGSLSNDSSGIKGFNIKSFEIPVLQLSIGIGDNTNLLLRYSEWKSSKLGKINVYGAGVKYELENLFSISPFPFNIGVLAIYQKYKIDNFIEGAVFGMNLLSSKKISLLPIEIYGGAGYINNVTNVSNPSAEKEVDVSIPGLDEIRYQLGINFPVLIFNINTEYNFGEYKSISAGIRIIL